MEEVTSVGFAGIMKYTRVHTKFVASLDTLTMLADYHHPAYFVCSES